MRHIRDSVLQRAMVIEDYTPRASDELELHRMDVLLVTKMIDDQWCEGFFESASKSGQVVGKFPAKCIQTLREDKLASKLRRNGYIDFSNMPSAAEWKAVLLGGKQHTYRMVRYLVGAATHQCCATN
jgi:hypothetical protein